MDYWLHKQSSFSPYYLLCEKLLISLLTIKQDVDIALDSIDDSDT